MCCRRKYRLGEINGGWAVLRDALNDEHGTVRADRRTSEVAHGRASRLLPRPSTVATLASTTIGEYRLGRGIARMKRR